MQNPESSRVFSSLLQIDARKPETISLEFVDDIVDVNDQHLSTPLSNKIIHNVQEQKKLTFSVEKCEMLKINLTKTDS